MKKIKITIIKDILSFSFKSEKEKVEPQLLNTNVISNDELLFSTDYIEKNIKIVSIFIKDLAVEKQIKKIIINEMEFAPQIIDVLFKIPSIDAIYIKEDVNLTFAVVEKIIKYKNVKVINCYSAPSFMIEMLDRKDIVLESRCEVFFTSKFMETNNLTQYSKIYYKSSIRITLPFSEFDFTDFETFCKINRYLKAIHLTNCQIDDLKRIVDILKDNKLRNVRINLHDNIQSEEMAEELKKLNKRWKSKYKIQLKVVYSQDYVKNNYLKQITLMTIKVCSILVFIIIASIIGYIFINNKTSAKNIKLINEEIIEVLNMTDDDETRGKANNLSALLNVNSDTIGWITVNNTNIDYPVVQTTNNDYYLTHNYKNDKDYSGWIFMDYRNDPDNLGKNTIIYGHNRYDSGLMFGTLSNALQKDWYENEDNLIITFNTLYHNHKWKIFSIYTLDVTTDYLLTYFQSDDEWIKFIKMISDRSVVKFDTEVNTNDQILTLSTCHKDSDHRLVVHAVEIE